MVEWPLYYTIIPLPSVFAITSYNIIYDLMINGCIIEVDCRYECSVNIN